jgi:glycosyltransferase involved in cell wall biosynthesis
MESKTILATAYAVNPFKGSEDGMGWNFVYQIARFQKVIAITRENNRSHIEQYMQENPDELYDNIQFYYFDLPYWMRFWKKGGRGAMLYFWMWQVGIVSFIKKLNITFDIAHNVNFHNDWTPSFLWKLNKPFVWGPIGHHPLIPNQYLHGRSRQYWWKDRMTWLVKKLFWKVSPSLKKSVEKADHVLCMNSSVSRYLPLRDGNYSIMPSVATQDFGWKRNNPVRRFRLISAGRLVPLKGFDLTIKAFAHFLNALPLQEKQRCELVIAGSGPELTHYQEMILDYDILPHVRLIDWIARKDLLGLYEKSNAFIFPSHEGAGMVIAEAMSFGLPVICLDNEGPGEFITDECGIRVPQGSYKNTIKSLTAAIYKLYQNPDTLESMSVAARKRFESSFHWDVRGEALHKIYQNL